MANNMIETFDLTKIFKLKGKKKEITALNNLNLSIKEGEIFGLLGPNGAGKTTLIHILTTLKQPTSGYATIDGINILKNPKQTKDRIALMLDNSMLYYRITGYDNLNFFCKIYNVPNYQEKINNMAKEFGLEKWLNQYVEHFSSGMKMKLALCRTLLLDRKILFLDEPTLGLDVKIISFIIDKIKKSKKTIFLTSHDMSVVEKLCDRVAFIDKGKILKVGTKDDIKRMMQKEIKIEIAINGGKNQLEAELNRREFVEKITGVNGGFTVCLKKRDYYKDLLLVLGKYNILKVREQELSLEDLFLKII
jgi:ABC-2 type transport system ATP-binding protein